MKILLTGAAGFLGWHTRVRLHALTDHDIVPVTRQNWSEMPALAMNADAIVHVAGVNRGDPDEVEHGNVRLAEDVASALKESPSVRRVIYANSTMAGQDTPYGVGKATAGTILADSAAAVGATYVNTCLPNIFGEGGRPDYNSFVATFVDKVVAGEAPEITDRSIHLLHVQDAAQALIEGLTGACGAVAPAGTATNVKAVYDSLSRMKHLYDTGDIPPLVGALDVALFNTLRSAMFPQHYPIPLIKHADQRGDLVEAVKAHGGQGQTFVSTTRPGVTRGEHFHLEKVERFIVIKGRARISLRKAFSDEIISFDVSGDEPAIVDMPTLWVHNITNTGDDDLVTLFWAHPLFDADTPDTFWEPVGPEVTA